MFYMLPAVFVLLLIEFLNSLLVTLFLGFFFFNRENNPLSVSSITLMYLLLIFFS